MKRMAVADRTRELERAAGINGIFVWHGSLARLTSTDIDARKVLVEHLTAICRAERRRGLAGHWTYDLARHNAIAALLKTEKDELASITGEASYD